MESQKKRKGGAERERDRKRKALATDGAKCCKISDMFTRREENSIQAFGNGSEDRTASSHPATPPPATETLSAPPVPTAPVSMETEQSILRAQIPTQENDRLWGDEEDSTLPSPGLSDASSKPSLWPLLLGTALLLPGPLFHLLLLSD
ncbi:unnamed protein product [Arctogadus glacialis]